MELVRRRCGGTPPDQVVRPAGGAGRLQRSAPAPPGHQAVDHQQDDGPDDGGQPGADVEELVDGVVAEQHLGQEPAEDGADDPDDDRHDDAARVVAGHDRLGDDAGDQAENDPTDDAHVVPPASVDDDAQLDSPVAGWFQGRSGSWMRTMPTAIDTTNLQTALTELARQVDGARPSAPVPGDLGPARRRRLAWHLDDYLLPRVRDLEAPLVCVLLGSTGAGKSSLLNGLAGAAVSPSGVVRPTTMRPVVLLAPGQVDAFMAGKVLAALADADRLQLVVHDGAFPEIALVDAPDVDSVEAENRRTAEELLQAADLCLFVTTAQRYADYVPWEFLRQAKARGVPLLVVVNRLPRRGADQGAVLADARRRFEEAGLGTAGPGGRDLPMLGVVEGARDPATDGLEASAIEPVRRALADLSADTAALTAVKAQALRGALAGLPAAVAEVAGDLEADRQRAAALRAGVERAYAAEQERLQDRLAGGDFLRGEVMRSWQ